MPNTVYIAQSLDGFIATPDGGIDWLETIENPEGDDFGFSKFMEGIDCLIMGRNTFEKVLTFGDWIYSKPVFVASTSLKEIPSHLQGKAFLVQGNPKEILKQVNDQGHKNVYVDGGRVIQSFLKEDLINRLIITTIPILLGGGIPLFGELEKSVKLKLVKSELLVGQMVKSEYVVVRELEN